MPCFYAPELTESDKKIALSGTEHHHMKNVFRKKEDDEILLTNGKGLLADGKIISISKKTTDIEILKTKAESFSKPEIIVAFPLLKNKHDNLIIEKLTELGIKEFYPIVSERTVRKPSKNILQKFEKVAISAIKQCDNAFLPKIHPIIDLAELIKKLSNEEIQILTALEFGENKLLSEVAQIKKTCLVIGPEGGFSEEEAAIMQAKKIQFFSLGNHILRAETAAIAASAQMLTILLEENRKYY